ncbi:hypothetical protein LBYZC6_45630 [Lacrimispora brassicae]
MPEGHTFMPVKADRKEETPCGYTFMPKNHGQERGNYGYSAGDCDWVIFGRYCY